MEPPVSEGRSFKGLHRHRPLSDAGMTRRFLHDYRMGDEKRPMMRLLAQLQARNYASSVAAFRSMGNLVICHGMDWDGESFRDSGAATIAIVSGSDSQFRVIYSEYGHPQRVLACEELEALRYIDSLILRMSLLFP